MRLGRIFAHRINSLLRRSRAEAELRSEIDLHLELLVREHIAAGLSEDEARLAARREFGSPAAAGERCRDTRRVNAVEDLLRDLSYAFRVLVKTPGFTLTAVVSLALGIGANAAIFSVVDAVLLRMLPVRASEQLVELTRPGGGALSYPLFEAIRNRNQVFSGVMLLSAGRYAASARFGDASLGDIRYSPVSGEYFDVLGLTPAIGRALSERDLDTANTAVISYAFWQRAFNRDPAIVGKALRVGGSLYTIVGVGPSAFRGIATGQPVDLWLPVTRSRNPVAMMFRVVARLKDGVSREAADANMQVLLRQLSEEWRFDAQGQIEVTSASGGLTQLRRRFAPPLLVLMAVSALLLLMAALNIANLLLARASARQREIGVRLSLGASRGRLIRQLLTESLVLGGGGGGLGLLIAPRLAAFLVRFLSSSVGVMELSFRIDARLLAFTLLISLAVALLFGMVPALAATRLDLTPMFGGAPRHGGSRRSASPGKLLVVAQVAISFVLLAAAVLFARSLATIASVDAGFNPDNVLLLHLAIGEHGPAGVARVRLFDRAVNRIASMPGVRSVAFSSESLFSGSTWTESVATPGFLPRPGADRESVLLAVSPGFFRTLGTPMIGGRDFETRDDERAPRVAIVNEAMARCYFGDAEPVGRTFRVESADFPSPLTVVGLVHNAKYRSLREPPTRIVYLPALQTPGPFGGANFAVRTAANPEKMADVLSQAARTESPWLQFGGATTQQRLVDGTTAQDRMLAELSVCFGVSAAVLVCLGLYGLTAYQVSRRTAEIGLRLALGAQPRDVVRMVLSGSLTLVACGSALGLSAAVLLTRLVENLLFGVPGADAVTLALTPALLLAIGAAAAYRPARRAARLDPMKSLRYE